MSMPYPKIKSDALAIAVCRHLPFQFTSPVLCMGGKARHVRYLSKLMPPRINHFYEPFAGGLSTSIFLIKMGRVSASRCYAGDIHRPLINFHNVLQSDYEALTLAILEDCRLHGRGTRELFEEAVDDINSSDCSFKQARGFYIHNRLGLSGLRLYQNNAFAPTLIQKGAGLTRSINLRLPFYGELMKDMRIEHRSYVDLLDEASRQGDGTFVFLDSPYEGHDANMYGVDFDFDDFAERCLAISDHCRFMITINDSPANRVRFEGLNMISRRVWYKLSESTKSELVICNYELDQQDYYLNQLGYKIVS